MLGFRSPAFLAAAAAVALLLSGCSGSWPADPTERTDGTTGPKPPSAAPAPAAVDWQPCPELRDELLGDLIGDLVGDLLGDMTDEVAPSAVLDQLVADVDFHCGEVPVPRDWDDPADSGTYDISLVRARHAEQTDRIGSLLLNPGGPGASGVDTAVLLSLGPMLEGLPDEVMHRFDLVGFDPRGVGRSAPVRCLDDATRDDSYATLPDPADDDEFDALVAQTREILDECADAHGDQAGHFSTRQTAHDLDLLRSALGDEQLTYLGYSYGSLLGAVYAQLYPENVRAMVLDGAVNPLDDARDAAEGQAQGFEQALDRFSQWCADSARCGLEPDGRTAVSEAIADADDAPVTGADGREATSGWVFWAVVATLYAEELWPMLADALAELDDGDPAGVFRLADAYADRSSDGTYSNQSDASLMINCTDGQPELAPDEVRDLQQQWQQEYPVFGGPVAAQLLSCALWPTDPDPYPTGAADGAPEILVVGTVGDPATPYESTQRLADMLGVGVVVTWEGEGHTAYPGPDCVDQTVNAYLIDLTVPQDGLTCPA